MEKTLWRMAVSQLIYTGESKQETQEGHRKSTGGRLRGQEKAKQGNLRGWVKSKTERHFFYIGGYKVVNK